MKHKTQNPPVLHVAGLLVCSSRFHLFVMVPHHDHQFLNDELCLRSFSLLLAKQEIFRILAQPDVAPSIAIFQGLKCAITCYFVHPSVRI